MLLQGNTTGVIYNNVYNLQATMYFKFTPASMVWSFGMIMYEIWSLGQEPYKQMTNIQVIRVKLHFVQ